MHGGWKGGGTGADGRCHKSGDGVDGVGRDVPGRVVGVEAGKGTAGRRGVRLL